MATKRPGTRTGSSKLNFRPTEVLQGDRGEVKGKIPLPERSSVQHVLLMMVLHVCRKAIFVDTSVKVAVYLGSLFVVSLIADVIPIPKTYFARSDNFLNQYFVKLGWGWTLIVALPFMVLTSYTYCCGKRNKVLEHLTRLGIATASWFFWIRLFNYIEGSYGRCNAPGRNFKSKSECLGGGFFWNGFDISGHAFILIYSSLVLIEEARAINGWEGIRDLIRNEEHSRVVLGSSANNSPLKVLSSDEFACLKDSYEKFTPYIRFLFIAMTMLTILWDVMLFCTMVYYHIMIEKFVSGVVAILMWFVTYRYWYTLPQTLPNLPGDGLFRYKDLRLSKEMPPKKRQSSLNNKAELCFWNIPLQCPTVACQQIWSPFTLVAPFYLRDVLVQESPMFVADSA